MSDPVLARLEQTVPLPPHESTGEVFHDLVSCLVEQQIHYRSTKHVFARALERAGLVRVTPTTFGAFESEGLADIPLSRQKREALASTTAFFQEHPDIEWAALSDGDVRATLKQFRGVGIWTIDMVLLFTLERPDVFPVDDYHLKQIMGTLYGIEPGKGQKRRMKDVAEAWRPERSRAVRLLLAWKEWQRELTR
ncbi:MAG: hypothetical protein AAGF99_14240 [Bacteroidota bacterium]